MIGAGSSRLSVTPDTTLLADCQDALSTDSYRVHWSMITYIEPWMFVLTMILYFVYATLAFTVTAPVVNVGKFPYV